MEKRPVADPMFYREILDSMPEGVVVADEDLRIVSLNEPCENMLNVSRRKAVGERLSKFFPAGINSLCARATRERRVVHEDGLSVTAAAGASARVECTASPAHGRDGSLVGLVLQIRDADKTGVLSTIDGSVGHGKSYENLVAGLAHEIGNPLSGIKGAAQLLDGPLSDEQRHRCSSIIVKEAERLKNLLERLAKPSGLAARPRGPVDINEILIDTVFLESNVHRNVEFRQNLDVTIPPVPGDRDSLKQVFLNIVRNAAAAVRGEGKITVSTRWVADYRIRDRHMVLISVSDDGEGIPEENLERIFTPFFSGRKDGTGLGLFISSRVVAGHGGIITAESAEGKGSVFRVRLPAGR